MGFESFLISGMKLLKRLRLLSLGGVDVSMLHSDTFFDMLSCLSILKDIVFPNSNISVIASDGISRCFEALESLRYVKSLDMGSTEIRKHIQRDLARVLPPLQLLEKLKLKLSSHLELNDKSANELFVALGKLKYLKELSIISDDLRRVFRGDALPEVLPSLQLLEKLELGFYITTDHCK